MDAKDLRDFYEYLIDSRSRMLEKARSLGWAEFSRDRGATWGSMLLVYLHMLDVEEAWLQVADRRGGTAAESPDRKAGDYRDFDAVAADSRKVDALTRSRLARLQDSDLGVEIEFFWPEKLVRTYERLAVHAFVDEVAHLGELVCLFWQSGVEPPFIDWLDYRLPP